MSFYWLFPDGVKRCAICREPKGEIHGENCMVGMRETNAALLAALEEAACWIPDGSRQTPEQRGAKRETADEVREMIAAAIARAKGETA